MRAAKPRRGTSSRKALALGRAPAAHEIAGGGEGFAIIVETDHQRRQRANAVGGADVRAAHFEVALEAHLGKYRREMIGPVGNRRALSRQRGEPAGEQIAKARARDIVINRRRA